MKKGIIEIRSATLSEVKDILNETKKDGELSFEQKSAYEYAKEFGKGSKKDIEKAMKELEEMGIDNSIAVRIINVKPESPNEVKLLFEKVRFDLKDEHIKKIIEISASF